MELDPIPGPIVGQGHLSYSMEIDVGALGGTTEVTLTPNHNLPALTAR